ncbi:MULTISPECIES: PleD family two-component system response regulator [unclassified Streptomyces]|uniref:Response regulator n=1 Tax=Streptomyces sp. NBC_00180 TaxID=2903632 RepID=A0AAU1IBH9_9ACTN|nr:response regulator [Streptomyces sp. NBC_01017]WSV34925.1 response regulator [Streptomyces sp. NBC_01017]
MVDDDRTNRMMLTYRLEVSGLQTATAENGSVALQMLREETFDLVLLDILMPELDGYGTLQVIKNDVKLRDVPVVMMSSLGEMDSVVRCLELGAVDYLPKPLDGLLLTSRVEGLLLKGRLRRLDEDYESWANLLADALPAAVQGTLDPLLLKDLAGRTDGLGRLAREIQKIQPAAQA